MRTKARGVKQAEEGKPKRPWALGFLFIALCLRSIIACHPHSGQNKPPMYGDFEAQRHWMEITIHHRIGEWYINTPSNDLMYWGLDYPPLSAYFAWLWGQVAQHYYPPSVELFTSRGIEDEITKSFMRFTVLVSDVLLLFPACFVIIRAVTGKQRLWWLVSMLFAPPLILIDHGHFQYNNVSLGLSLWAVAMAVQSHWLLSALLFTMALHFKQMSLYFAPAFFIMMLVASVKGNNFTGSFQYLHNPALRVAALGVVVLATSALIYAPFWTFPTFTYTPAESLAAVLKRLFPVDRGIFEDKVSNVWCTVEPLLKLRNKFSKAKMFQLAMAATLGALLPVLLNLGRSYWKLWSQAAATKSQALRLHGLALFSCSLVFFLFSFQVHEKSILLPWCGAILLFPFYPALSTWFTTVATLSMMPLLMRDGLLLPMWVLSFAYFVALAYVTWPAWSSYHRVLLPLSIVPYTAINVLWMALPPPPSLPDLYPLLTSAYSCGLFLLALAWTFVAIWWQPAVHDAKIKED